MKIVSLMQNVVLKFDIKRGTKVLVERYLQNVFTKLNYTHTEGKDEEDQNKQRSILLLLLTTTKHTKLNCTNSQGKDEEYQKIIHRLNETVTHLHVELSEERKAVNLFVYILVCLQVFL